MNDGWTEIIRNLIHGIKEDQNDSEMTPQDFMNAMEFSDFQKMEQIRGRVDEVVKDEKTAE